MQKHDRNEKKETHAINRYWIILCGCSALLLLGGMIYAGSNLFNQTAPSYFAGSELHIPAIVMHGSIPAIRMQKEDESQRYQRPSDCPPLANPYTFQQFRQNESPQMEAPSDVIYAYYAILKEASNMLGYSGGCGTIGMAQEPYPYAYQLLAAEYQQKMSLEQFEESFQGIGHITFLKCHLLPETTAAEPPPQSYFVEIEVITGMPEGKDDGEIHNQSSSFAYYYGIVTVVYEGDAWKIGSIDYLPENFLCAPYHSWFYDATAVVQIVYINNLQIADKITNILKKKDRIYIYAEGDGVQYRFDFVRLTNGYDILINEAVCKDGKWSSVNLLTGDWKGLKLDKESFE